MFRPNFSFSGSVPKIVWVTVGILVIFGFLTPNASLTIASALLLSWFFLLLWRPGEPPILLLALGFQWLQVVTKVYKANFLGLPVEALSEYHGDVELAIWLSMMALAVLALGMRVVLAPYDRSIPEVARNQALSFSPSKLFVFYLVANLFSIIILSGAWLFPGITQIALAMSNLKWVVFFTLAYVCFVRPGAINFLLLAFVIEFALGIGGYFSNFKVVFFVTILAILASGKTYTTKQLLSTLILVSALFYISLLWTAVKSEYRHYLSGGEKAQIVTREYVERVTKLFDLIDDVEEDDLYAAISDMADRIAYVEFFGRVLIMVPDRIPHENGELWGGALRHIFMPRLFFPDKQRLRSDSEITISYTGVLVSGEESGTSISIGYVAESYIDFGFIGMLFPVFVLGLLWGGMYRYFLTRPKLPLVVGYGLAVTVLMGAYQFEITNTKLLGGVVTSFLVAYIAQRFFIKKLLRLVLIKRRTYEERAAYLIRQS